MNYRHIYHAGNFADVIKHLVLISLLKHMKKKSSDFCAIDLFAGLGIYNLNDDNALKTNESNIGIKAVLRAKDRLCNIEIQDFIEIINTLNVRGENFYPGSPYIISRYLRKQDSLIANELHPEDYRVLKRNFYMYDNIHIHNIDAYQATRSLLPPKIKRGLVLLDPPFEKLDEFIKLELAVKEINKRFLSSIVMIWFPIKGDSLVEKFCAGMLKLGSGMLIEFTLGGGSFGTKLHKVGIYIVRPPWLLEDMLTPILDLLISHVYIGAIYKITITP